MGFNGMDRVIRPHPASALVERKISENQGQVFHFA